MGRLVWLVIAAAALALALLQRAHSAAGGESAQPAAQIAARPTASPLRSSPTLRPQRPAVLPGAVSARDRTAGQSPSPVASAPAVRQDTVIRPDREEVLARRAAEARRLAEERRRAAEQRRAALQSNEAIRRQQERARRLAEQREASIAQMQALQAGLDRSRLAQRQQRTAPMSNLARSLQSLRNLDDALPVPGGALAGEQQGQGGEAAQAVEAFQEQTTEQAPPRSGGGGGGFSDPALQGLIETLTGAGFSADAASQLVSLATGGPAPAGGVAPLVTLFAPPEDGAEGGSPPPSDDGGQTPPAPSSGASGASGAGQDGQPPTDGVPPAPAGGGGDDGSSPPSDGAQPPAEDGGSPPPSPPPPPAQQPAAVLVGLTLSASALEAGGSTTATVQLLQPVAVETIVTLSADSPLVTLPAAVVTPDGAVTATFTITAAEDVAQETLVVVTAQVGEQSRSVGLTIRPAGLPEPPPPVTAEPAIELRWIPVGAVDCLDDALSPPVQLQDHFSNDLYVSFKDPPTVDGAGSPLPLIVDSSVEAGLRIEGGQFFQHPLGGNGPPKGQLPTSSDAPSCLPFDSHMTVGGADPLFLPQRSPPLADWPSPLDAAWFTIRFGDAQVEQDASRFGDNRFYVRIARLTAPRGSRVFGQLRVFAKGAADLEGGELLDVPDEPSLWSQFDVNGDGAVTAADAKAVSEQLGQRTASSPADINGDGVVNEPDLRLLVRDLGSRRPPGRP